MAKPYLLGWLADYLIFAAAVSSREDWQASHFWIFLEKGDGNVCRSWDADES
jgi:hypothetical protein